jgi:hypothetical protein
MDCDFMLIARIFQKKRLSLPERLVATLKQSSEIGAALYPDLQDYREAVDWSIREVKQGSHGDDL